MAAKKWTKERIAEYKKKILFEMSENGLSLRKISTIEGFPANKIIFEWLKVDKSFSEQYARAREIMIDAKFDSIAQDYLEEPQRDAKTGNIDTAWVALQRLKIDAKKWELSKLNPKKYGERLDVTSDNEKIESQITILRLPDNGRDKKEIKKEDS